MTPRASALQGMTPRQIAMLAGGVDAPQGVATGEADTDVCGPAGSMTTVRANAPDTYGIAQRRVALRKQAETCVHTADGLGFRDIGFNPLALLCCMFSGVCTHQRLGACTNAGRLHWQPPN